MLKKSKKYHIIIETSSFDTGGLERVVLDSALLFKENGYKVSIFSTGKLGLLAMESKRHGIKVFGGRSYVKLGMFLCFARPTVSISHFANFGYPIYKFFGIPNITFIHNIYAFLDEDKKRKLLEDDKYVTRYISVSDTATSYAVNNLNLSPLKIATIPNGIIVSQHEDLLRESTNLLPQDIPGLNDTDFIFLNVAAYNLHKGHYLMASALKEVNSVHPNAKILCVGSEVYLPHLQELKKYLIDQNLTNNMILAGYFSNVTPLYLRADCFLLPSFIEGWSIAMTEAMFYELPMVLTKVGGAPEVIEENDIGILISNEFGEIDKLNLDLLNEISYSPREYAVVGELRDAMINMIENSTSWQARAKLGKQKVISHYNFESIIMSYIAEIEFVQKNFSK